MNQAVAPYWEMFEKPIIDDSATEFQYTEIRENSVIVSQQLS